MQLWQQNYCRASISRFAFLLQNGNDNFSVSPYILEKIGVIPKLELMTMQNVINVYNSLCDAGSNGINKTYNLSIEGVPQFYVQITSEWIYYFRLHRFIHRVHAKNINISNNL